MKKLLKSCLFFLFVGNVVAKPASAFLEEAYTELKKCSDEHADIENIIGNIQNIAKALREEDDLTFDSAWSNYYDTNINPYLDEINRFLSFLEAVKMYKNDCNATVLSQWTGLWKFSEIIDKLLHRESLFLF